MPARIVASMKREAVDRRTQKERQHAEPDDLERERGEAGQREDREDEAQPTAVEDQRHRGGSPARSRRERRRPSRRRRGAETCVPSSSATTPTVRLRRPRR